MKITKSKKFLIPIVLVAILVPILIIAARSDWQKENSNQNTGQVQEAKTKQLGVFKDITVEEAEALIRDDQGNLVIIDIRSQQRYLGGHIANSKNFDFSADNFQEEIDRLDKTKAYLIYCQIGSRSKEAAVLMERLGFTEVYSLVGGIDQWGLKGLPTVR